MAIDHNAGSVQDAAVLVSIRNLKRGPAARRCPCEAIAANRRVSIRQLNRNQFAALQGQQPTDRPTEPLRSRAPTHEAPALQGTDPTRDQLLKQGATGLPRRHHRGEHAGALRCLADLQLGWINATALGETNGRRAGLSVLESLCQRRSLALLGEIRLAFLQRFNLNDQTSWCSGHQKAAVVKTVLLEIPEDKILQLRQSQTAKSAGNSSVPISRRKVEVTPSTEPLATVLEAA